MNISQLIQKLESLKQEHGDVEVVCLHSLDEHARSQLDIIKGKPYLTTVEHVMHRNRAPGFEEPHILITL